MRRKWWIVLTLTALLAGLAAGFVVLRGFDWPGSPWAQGKTLDTLNGVAVYDNGPVPTISHGRNYASDGYYFGQKWQCVEFAKRYLYRARSHRMPDGMGTAVSFFDPETPQAALNERRGMTQYRQGGLEPPAPSDMIVFDDGGEGYVAIVAAVGEDFVEVVQQNVVPARERLSLTKAGGVYRIHSGRTVLGWLRVPTMQADLETKRPRV